MVWVSCRKPLWSEEAGVRILRGEGLCQLGAGKAARAEIKIAIVI